MAETLVLVVPVLAVLAAIFLARAAVQRGGVAVALCWWLLAALVVPIASIIIAALIIDAVNDRADGFVFFTLFFSRLLVVVNAFLYWFAYAIFQAKQTEKSRSFFSSH